MKSILQYCKSFFLQWNFLFMRLHFGKMFCTSSFVPEKWTSTHLEVSPSDLILIFFSSMESFILRPWWKEMFWYLLWFMKLLYFDLDFAVSYLEMFCFLRPCCSFSLGSSIGRINHKSFLPVVRKCYSISYKHDFPQLPPITDRRSFWR